MGRFLDQKAVQGHTAFQSSMELSVKEQHALKALAEHGWVCEHQCQALPEGSAWQLSTKFLQTLRVNMVLHFPWNVFTRRADVALDQATSFELMLTLRSNHWKEESSDVVKKKKSHAPFKSGVSGRLGHFDFVHDSWICGFHEHKCLSGFRIQDP